MTVLRRVASRFAVVPLVAVLAYAVMALLPMAPEVDSKHALGARAVEAYRRDLGLGERFGVLVPWRKLLAGARLGSDGVTGGELLTKLGISLRIGLAALAIAVALAFAYALVRERLRRRRGQRWPLVLSDLLPTLAFGSPVFVTGLLVAPSVAERGHGIPELACAALIALWPGMFLGTVLADALDGERAKDYVRTARAKGLSDGKVLLRHVAPNLWPPLLDALVPVATALCAGSFAAERVFGIPGFGQLYVLAVIHKQLAVVVIATTFFAALLGVVGLAVDVARLALDPRARTRGLE